MTRSANKAGNGGNALALVAAAGLVLALPSAGLALSDSQTDHSPMVADKFAPFTPAAVDPQLARRFAASVRAKGQNVRFTPAATASSQARTYTVAVRVDEQTARAISVRSAVAATQAEAGLGNLALGPTRYNLGAARGYQGFTKISDMPKAGISLDIGGPNVLDAMPDLAEFKPLESKTKGKPSRFQPRIELETEIGTAGRSKGTLESLGEQRVDLGGAYRVSRNLDVTAGVRLSQDRDRIAPLTDSVQDSQAVYVGTQFRF